MTPLLQHWVTPASIPVQWCREAWDCQVSAAMIIKWIDLRGTFYNCAKLISTWHVLRLVFLPPEASWTEYIANFETSETWQIRDIPNVLEAHKESILIPPPLLHLGWHNPTSETEHLSLFGNLIPSVVLTNLTLRSPPPRVALTA